MSKKLDELDPDLYKKYLLFKDKMLSINLPFILTRTGCSEDEQKALYAQGRQSYEEISMLRDKAGMYPISIKESQKIVTWTLNSKHIINTKKLKSKAFDFALTDLNKPHWNTKTSVNNNDIPDYTEAGLIAESVGLKWGGRFKTPDYCHVEI